MKKLIAALALAALPLTAAAQGQTIVPLAIDYDVDDTVVYVHSQGVPIATFGATSRAEGVLAEITSPVKVVTSGSSTTVAASVASSAPFTALQVGDFIRFRVPGQGRDVLDAIEGGQTPWLKVTAKASANSITVSQAVNLTSAVSFQWRRAIAATTEGAGWIPVGSFQKALFVVNVRSATGASANAVEAAVECRADQPGFDTFSATRVRPRLGTDATNVFVGNDCASFDVVSSSGQAVCVIPPTKSHFFEFDTKGWAECRLVLGVNDDVGDVGVERVYATFIGVN